MNNCLIYAPPRSGSSHLLRRLTDAAGLIEEQIAWEPFKLKNRSKYVYRDLSDLANQVTGNCRIAKHLWTQLNREDNQVVLNSRGVGRVVFLYRRALFDQALSLLVARKTREWLNVSDQDPFFINPDTFFLELQRIRQSVGANIDLLRSTGRPFVIVPYELLYHQSEAVREYVILGLLQFLEIDPERGRVREMVRQCNPARKYKSNAYYRQVVTNYRRLLKRFGSWNDYYYRYPQKKPEIL